MNVLLASFGALLVFILDKDWHLANLWRKGYPYRARLEGFVSITRKRLNGQPFLLFLLLLASYLLFFFFAMVSQRMVGSTIYDGLAKMFVMVQLVDAVFLLRHCLDGERKMWRREILFHKLGVIYSAVFLSLSAVLLLFV